MATFKVILGECEPVLAELPSKGVAIITDPPYGISLETDYRANQRGKLAQCNDFPRIHGDDRPFDPAHLLRFEAVVLFGANHFADKLPQSSGWFIWDKRDGMSSNDQSDCELAWTNRQRAARIFRHRWNGMIKASEKDSRRVHPTQKPVALFKWVITQLQLPQDTLIVDPYLGSGPCGVAAGELGYNFLGVEIVEQYYKAAVKRISAAFAQPLLFNHSRTQQSRAGDGASALSVSQDNPGPASVTGRSTSDSSRRA